MRPPRLAYCQHPAMDANERRDLYDAQVDAADRTAARSSADTVEKMRAELDALPPASCDYWTNAAFDRCHAFIRRAALIRRKHELHLREAWCRSGWPASDEDPESRESVADDLWYEAHQFVELLQRMPWNRWNRPEDERPRIPTWDERIATEEGPHLFIGDALTWGAPVEQYDGRSSA